MRSPFAGRRVLVTGHTGFKGAWLVLWLRELGAEVSGYALPPATTPSLYIEARIRELMHAEALADVGDARAVHEFVQRTQPEVVFHLAAQAIVRRGYREPVETWRTNVMGVAHLLEAVRATPSVRVCQIITSDKCYENPGRVCAFRESDPMGGHDPYSASKGAAEIAVAAWRRSYFAGDDSASIASARAGNVIGGGDWADDRIIPDCIRALERHQPIAVRNPQAVRPWQHVLEPLAGYLRLAERQLEDGPAFADAFNFGPAPTGVQTVGDVVDRVVEHWGGGRWEHRPSASDVEPRGRTHEAAFLTLDITKASTLLGWRPIYSLDEAVAETVQWYRRRHSESDRFDARAACCEQIARYRQRQPR